MPLHLHDVVAVIRDFPEARVMKGDRGTVIAVFERPCVALEVEFCDGNGVTTAQLVLCPDDVVLVASRDVE